MNTPLNLSRLPADYTTPELTEARELLEQATADHSEALARANSLSEQLDHACGLKATADRTYGAAPTPKNRDARLAAQTAIDDLQLQLDAATESVVEFEEPRNAAKAHLARVEAEVLAQHRADIESAKKAQAKDIAAALGEIAGILNRDRSLAPLVRGQLDDPTHAALQTLSNRVVRL